MSVLSLAWLAGFIAGLVSGLGIALALLEQRRRTRTRA